MQGEVWRGKIRVGREGRIVTEEKEEEVEEKEKRKKNKNEREDVLYREIKEAM